MQINGQKINYNWMRARTHTCRQAGRHTTNTFLRPGLIRATAQGENITTLLVFESNHFFSHHEACNHHFHLLGERVSVRVRERDTQKESKAITRQPQMC